jgi:hypothetical protein
MGTCGQLLLLPLLTALWGTIADAQVTESSKYPTNWKGQWNRVILPGFDDLNAGLDPTKKPG